MAVILVLGNFCAVAHADHHHFFVNRGAGTYVCRDLNFGSAGRARGIDAWLLGFMTAASAYRATETGTDFMEGVDNAFLTQWLRNHCHEHPEETLVNAALKLVHEIKQRPQAESPAKR